MQPTAKSVKKCKQKKKNLQNYLVHGLVLANMQLKLSNSWITIFFSMVKLSKKFRTPFLKNI